MRMQHQHATGCRLKGRAASTAFKCISRRPLRVCAAADTAAYKKSAATLFVDEFVKDNQVIGLGSGELSSLVIEEIGQRIMTGKLKSVQGVPTTDAAAAAAAFHGVPLHPESSKLKSVDLAFDQVNQLDANASACVLGVAQEPQQPQLLRMLSMAQQRAKHFIALVEAQQVVQRLSGTLPVLVDHDTWEETAEEIDDTVIGDAEVWRRAVPGTVKPNPRGGDNPFISEEGHNIIDVKYDGAFKLFGELEPYHKIEDTLMDIPGMVATGLLLGVAEAAVVAAPAGPQVIQLSVDTTAKAAMQVSNEG